MNAFNPDATQVTVAPTRPPVQKPEPLPRTSPLLDARATWTPDGSTATWLADARTALTELELAEVTAAFPKGFSLATAEYCKTALAQGKTAGAYAREKRGQWGFSLRTIATHYAALRRAVGEGLREF